MLRGRGTLKLNKMIICIIIVILIFKSIFIGITIKTSNAAVINHDVSNLKINMLTDYGRILGPINWNGPQTVEDQSTPFGFIGLVIDHDNYDHTPGAEDIADSFSTWPYASQDDFNVVNPISLVVNDPPLQKSIASFRNEGVRTGDPNDISINQTCWTVINKDWAIIQWTLNNIKSPASTLTNVRIGLEVPISKEGGRYGLGGTVNDAGDDIDGYDAVDDIYWAQDTGDGTTLGFSSAIVSDPITHYFAEDYSAPYANSSNPMDPNPIYYNNFFANDTWLYQRITAPSATATDSITPENITATVGWDGFDILSGESRTVTLVIAANDTYNNMKTAIADAQDYYLNVATGFKLTEIRDSGSATSQIEVFNNGREPLANPSSLLTLTSSSGPLTGSWSADPIPTYGYSYFTPNEVVGAEGDTVRLYESAVLIDEISYGQDGIAPDPLDSESTARYWDSSISAYNDDWTREEVPTFGAQNHVPPINKSSFIVLNEVMFNPLIPDDYFITLYLMYGSLDISGYKIVCDSEYIIPIGTVMGPGIQFFNFTFPMDPAFFVNMDSSGDNVYLYDNNGSLLDMAGWSSSHTQGKTMRRVPNGNGTRNGYDDPSSVAAGWVFEYGPPVPPQPPSPPKGLMAKLVSNAMDVMLTWNASEDDGFGEDDVAGYTVYKSITGINGSYEFKAWIPAIDSLSYNWIDLDAGDEDWDDYFYIVRANDTLNNEENNGNKAGKFVNYLYDNWNLFSVPLIQFDNSLNYVLQTIDDNYTIIQGYHAGKSRPWLHMHKKKPPQFNDEIEISIKEGYYIKMTNPDYLVVAGTVPTNTQISLKTGWNLVGYPCLINQTRDTALSSITGKYNKVEYYDPVLEKEVGLGPNDWMNPGYGYWIHATEDCILTI